MKNIHFLSIFLCLVGILAQVATQPTNANTNAVTSLIDSFGNLLQKKNYGGIWDLMGTPVSVTIDNQLFKQMRTVSSKNEFVGILNSYNYFAPMSLGKKDAPVYLSTTNNFKFKMGAELVLQKNPFGAPLRIDAVFTFKTKTPDQHQVQSVTLTVYKNSK